MAYELKVWKRPGCFLSLEILKLSNREIYSREINEICGEGGGLNADYRTVEAVAKAANILGARGLRYGEDFVFKTSSLDEIFLDFCDPATRDVARQAFQTL